MPDENGFHGLGRRILDTLMAHPGEFGLPKPIAGLALPPVASGLPEFVLESEAALLFGEAPARSLSLAVPIRECGAADGIAGGPDGLAWTFGTPLAQTADRDRKCHFLQIILVDSPEPVSRPFLSGLASLRSLTGRLPGYLAHSVGHETTARVHRDLLAAGLTLELLAQAHLAQARARGFTGRIFVAVGIPSPRALELMEPFRDELRLMSADLSTAVAEAARERPEGCEGRSCSDCDDRDVCDKVRAVLAAHPKNQGKRGTP